MTTEEITTKLREPFPVEVIEEKNGLNYIPHEIVRERLIEATGNTFDWSIDQVLFRDDGVTRRANDRHTGEPRRPMSMLVIGTLSIPGLGKRAGVGAHPLDEGAGEDAAYKSAESDAIKRAAMCFGVGLGQLYIETGEAKRNKNKPRQAIPAKSTPKPAPKRQPDTRTDEEYGKELREAMAARDASTFRKLVEDADEQIGRWIALVQSANTQQSLDWIKRQAERREIRSDQLTQAIAKQEEINSRSVEAERTETPVTMETHPYNPPRQWTPDASDASVKGTATQEQRNKMFAIAKSADLGMDEAGIKAELLERFGVESSRAISIVQMNSYIRELEKRQAEARRKVNEDVPF